MVNERTNESRYPWKGKQRGRLNEQYIGIGMQRDEVKMKGRSNATEDNAN